MVHASVSPACLCTVLLSDLGQFTGQDGSESGTWGVRTMVSQLLVHQRIETTLGRAKELRRLADKVITISKEVCKLRRTAC